MPRHDFQCSKCGNIQEEIFHIGEDVEGARTKCCKCGASAKRVFTAGNSYEFVLRGGIDGQRVGYLDKNDGEYKSYRLKSVADARSYRDRLSDQNEAEMVLDL